MPTRPRHYAVFILNPDGSGMVKQFDTWQEAMTAYADSSNAGKAVYLYPQPTKAVGIGNTPIAPPVSSTGVTFTAAQNVGQYEWPAHPPLPRPTERGPGSNPFFEPDNYDLWMTYCTANPTHRECTVPGKEKFGTVASTVCSLIEGSTVQDDTGQPFPASIPTQIKHDGLGGTFEAGPPEGASNFDSPCHLPNGFQQYGQTTYIAPSIVIFTLKSAATAGPAFHGNAVVEMVRELKMWNGSGGSEVVRTEHGLPAPGGYFEELVPAEDGDSIYTLLGSMIGTIDVVYPLMPSSDSYIEEVGEEEEEVMVTITERGTTVRSGTRFADKFENKWPEMNPDSYVSNIGYDPEFGTGTGSWSITHGPGEAFNGVKFEWIPGTPADGRPPAGWAGYVGRDASGDFDKVNPPVPAPEGQTWLGEWTYVYYPEGTILDEDSENYYKADGLGGYTVEAIDDDDDDDDDDDCDPVDEDLGVDPNDSCNNLYADGYCGTYSNSNGSCDGGCEDSSLHSNDPAWSFDGCYWTYTGCEDSTAHTDGSEGWTWDGCNWSYDDRWNCEDDAAHSSGEGWSYDGCTWSYDPNWNCDAEGTDLGVDPSDSCQSIYADGMCGTYTNSNGSCDDDDDCDPSGTNLGIDPNNSCDDLYADGNCGTYSSSNGSCCDPSGTDLGVDSSDSCNNIYADGVCGTYTSDNGSCDGDDDDDDCDPAGETVSTGNTSALYITTPCGEVEAGTRTYDVYTDGNCGTTEQTTNEAWSSNGTELNSCSDGTEICTYYADGNGSYTTSCSPIIPPDECESDSLHEEGEDGWTYDGCNWTQPGNWTEEFPDAGEPYPGEEDFPEEDSAGGNENDPPHEEGTGIAYENAFINGDGNWDINFV